MASRSVHTKRTRAVPGVVLALLLATIGGCLSRTAAPELPPFEGAAVPAAVSPTYGGGRKIWAFRVALANNTDQDLRLASYDVEILDTDTGYRSAWTVVPAKETVVRSFSDYSYAADYRTVSLFRAGKQRRVYRAVGMQDGATFTAEFVVELLN